MAIEHAQRILHWQENLPQEEMPPQWMWVVDEELEEWFEEVDRKRKERFGTPDSSDESVPMTKNEMSRR